CYSGKRIILIPYLLENHHWTGILIEWNSIEEIERSQFIDPVTGSDSIPDKLQKNFIEIFAKNVLHSKTMLKHEDRTKSAMLTIANLLKAVQNSGLHQSSSQQNFSSLSTSEGLSAWHKDQDGSTTSCEGNQMNLDELEKRLSSGLAKFKISDMNILSDRIRRSKDRIEEYRATERIEDAEKEMKYLREYEMLAELAEKINRAKSNASKLDTTNLEKQLADDLAKMRISDVKLLSARIARSEKRIDEYREEGRSDEAEKEQKILNECKRLQTLAEDIRTRKSMGSD
ncbi:unnamed protein product, partial [Didymodactylos carnosus]